MERTKIATEDRPMTCQHCGESIAYIGGRWLHSSGPNEVLIECDIIDSNGASPTAKPRVTASVEDDAITQRPWRGADSTTGRTMATDPRLHDWRYLHGLLHGGPLPDAPDRGPTFEECPELLCADHRAQMADEAVTLPSDHAKSLGQTCEDRDYRCCERLSGLQHREAYGYPPAGVR